MNKKKILLKFVFSLVLVSTLSFNSCEKFDCWYCTITNDSGYIEDKFTCDERKKNDLESRGWSCGQD